jgi:putative redox protein
MADTHRQISIERVSTGTYRARNSRGGEITVGGGDGADFSPVELLMVAIGGCTAVDVDYVTSRRAEPDHFVVAVDAEKIKAEGGNQLEDIVVTFKIAFPEGEQGDKARAVLPDIVRQSHDRLCTVSRTVERGTPIATRIES